MLIRRNLILILYYVIVGEKVNIEVDVLAKMVERSLKGVYDSSNSSSNTGNDAAVVALTAKVLLLEATVQSMQATLNDLVKSFSP